MAYTEGILKKARCGMGAVMTGKVNDDKNYFNKLKYMVISLR